jgi:hypothetical protein
MLIQRQYDIVIIPPTAPHAVFNIGLYGAAVATNIHTYSTIRYSFTEHQLQMTLKLSEPYQMRHIYRYVEDQLLKQDLKLIEIDRANGFSISNYFIRYREYIHLLIYNKPVKLFDGNRIQTQLVCTLCKEDLVSIWVSTVNGLYCIQCTSITQQGVSVIEKEEQQQAALTEVGPDIIKDGLLEEEQESLEEQQEEQSDASKSAYYVIDKYPLQVIKKLKETQQQQQ